MSRAQLFIYADDLIFIDDRKSKGSEMKERSLVYDITILQVLVMKTKTVLFDCCVDMVKQLGVVQY